MTGSEAIQRAVDAAKDAEKYLHGQASPDTARARAAAEVSRAWTAIAAVLLDAPRAAVRQ